MARLASPATDIYLGVVDAYQRLKTGEHDRSAVELHTASSAEQAQGDNSMMPPVLCSDLVISASDSWHRYSRPMEETIPVLLSRLLAVITKYEGRAPENVA